MHIYYEICYKNAYHSHKIKNIGQKLPEAEKIGRKFNFIILLAIRKSKNINKLKSEIATGKCVLMRVMREVLTKMEALQKLSFIVVFL
ncbi:MAG: hypothetical protein AB8Y83_02100 [Coxiella endosymbiont of Haemaphysalis qinghaiensis]